MSDGQGPGARPRRALSNLGGEAILWGPPAFARPLQEALGGLELADPDLLTHGFHTYPARLHPLLCRRLLERVARPGDVVLDPFCGGGTAVLEALVRGCQAIGTDINPIALRIARSRTHVWTPERIRRHVAALTALAEENFRDARKKVAPPLSAVARAQARWYSPHVLLEISSLYLRLQGLEGELRELGLMVFSSILVKVSLQTSDTREEVTSRQIGRGTVSRLFGRKAAELGERLEEVFTAVLSRTPPVVLRQADARALPGRDSSVDLILTSPPYPGTYDYVSHQARRFAWLEEDPHFAQTHEIGARRQAPELRRAWREDERAFLREFARVLRPGGQALVMIGDGVLEDRAYLEDEAIADAAGSVGLEVLAVVSQPRPPTHPQQARAFAQQERREHLLHLRKAG